MRTANNVYLRRLFDANWTLEEVDEFKAQIIADHEANDIELCAWRRKTTKKRAAKFWAKYFDSTISIALNLNHMTIDCMVKFTNEEIKNLNTPQKRSGK